MTAVQDRSLPVTESPVHILPEPGRAPGRPRRSPHPRRVWAQQAIAAVAANRTRLKAIQARADERPLPAAQADALAEGIEALLNRAERAARGIDPGHTRFVSWWRGNCIEAAYQNLHRAEAEMVRLYSDDEVDAEVPEAVARAEIGLNRDDPRRAAAVALPSMRDAAAKRVALSKTVQIGHEATERMHSRVRAFRNIVLVAAILLALFVSIFAFWAAGHPGSVPLCFTTPDLAVHCPTGPGPPSPGDVEVVILLGLLGSALAAAVSIRNIRGTSMPYNVAAALALLKFPAGALTAIGALVAISGELVPGLSALDTQQQILAYALVFGYAQQLLTGLVDRRAQSLLGNVPSKDPAQDRPAGGREQP